MSEQAIIPHAQAIIPHAYAIVAKKGCPWAVVALQTLVMLALLSPLLSSLAACLCTCSDQSIKQSAERRKKAIRWPGIEPGSSPICQEVTPVEMPIAWQGDVLPLDHQRVESTEASWEMNPHGNKIISALYHRPGRQALKVSWLHLTGGGMPLTSNPVPISSKTGLAALAAL